MATMITDIILDLYQPNRNPIYAKQADADSRFFSHSSDK